MSTKTAQYITLKCPRCKRTKRVRRLSTDPKKAKTVRIVCDRHDTGGEFHA